MATPHAPSWNTRKGTTTVGSRDNVNGSSMRQVQQQQQQQRSNPARKSWGGETLSRGGWGDDAQHAPRTRVSPKSSPSAANRTTRARPSPASPSRNSDQLAHQKNQWNVARDIPSGTVRNNPFLPKPDPANAPPPQLMHQKRQWDTSDIPRGAVAARTMSMEIDPRDEPVAVVKPSLRLTPQGKRFDPQPSHRIVVPSPGVSPLPIDNAKANRNRRSFPFETNSQANYTHSSTGATASLRGRIIENPVISASSTSEKVTSPRWQPSREIPPGTVKGKHKLFSTGPEKHTSHQELNFSSPKGDDQSDEDPWIIPSKASTTAQVFPGDWGEAVAAKSSESDDWDTPDTDWLRSSESQTTVSDSKERFQVKTHRERASIQHTDISMTAPAISRDLGIIEEKKHNEEDSLAGNRDADILNLARQKQSFQDHDHDPFATAHARETEILQAAKQKVEQVNSRKSSNFHSEAFDPAPTNTETFEGDIFADAKASPELEYAFPSSPFGQHETLQAFEPFIPVHDGKDSLRNEQVTTASNQSHTPAPPVALDSNFDTSRNRSSVVRQEISVHSGSKSQTSSESVQNQENDPEPRKQRKGFFNFFGGGRKDKTDGGKRLSISTPGRRNGKQKSHGSPSSTKSNRTYADVTPRQNITLSTKAEGHPTDSRHFSEPHNAVKSPRTARLGKNTRGHDDHGLFNKKSEDDTTVSEMTLPTFFKDSLNPSSAWKPKSPSATNIDAQQDWHTPSGLLPRVQEPSEDAGISSPVHSNRDVDAVDVIDLVDRIEDTYSDDKQLEKHGQTALHERDYESMLNLPPPPPPPPRTAQDKLENFRGDEKTLDYSDPADDPALDHIGLDDNSLGNSNPQLLGVETGAYDAAEREMEIQGKSRRSLDETDPHSTQIYGSHNVGDPELNHVSLDDDSIGDEAAITSEGSSEVGKSVTSSTSSSFNEAAAIQASQNRLRRRAKNLKKSYAHVASHRTSVEPQSEVKSDAGDTAVAVSRPVRLSERKNPKFVARHVKPRTSASQTPSETGDSDVAVSFPASSIGDKKTPKFVARHNKTKTNRLQKPIPENIRESHTSETMGPASTLERTSHRTSTAATEKPAQGRIGVEKVGHRMTTAVERAGQKKTTDDRTVQKSVPNGQKSTLDGIRQVQASKESGQRHDLRDLGGLTVGRSQRDIKFAKASKAFQQGQKSQFSHQPEPSGPILENLSRDSASVGKNAEESLRSQRTNESSSVGSDIRALRSILRRPRLAPPADRIPQPKPVFASYDENNITDPMQRAGLRLLSAAIIPIQTEARRFLAMRRALTRMWALIVIQTYARRWMARRQFEQDISSIITVQALARGRNVRNDIVCQHICAIEIQRHVRGYLSTMRVYEAIFKVTMIQSYVRMKLAMEEATRRMALVIQLQAVARRFLVRRRHEYQEACAIAIQANWRCFFTRLTYQFDLLDIIIVQSVWRRNMATQQVEELRQARRNRCATIIQAKWRSYDCTMNYLHYLADVLIVQSTVRRFLVLKRVRTLKNEAATKIQSVWRGFVCYADYMFSIADIVVVQKVARRWKACRITKALRHEKHSKAASVIQKCWTKFYYARKIQRAWRLRVFRVERENAAIQIQKRWRCFVDETEFVVMKYEYYAARTIQSYWRKFWCFSNFIIALDCSIQIQAAFRGFAERQRWQTSKQAAISIESVARMFIAKKEASRLACSQRLAAYSSVAATLEAKAATLIESQFRSYQCQKALKFYYAARTIQSLVRGQQARTAVHLYLCARTIQAAWRRVVPLRVYTSYMAARKIQTCWRRYCLLRAYVCYRAARSIQTKWRGTRLKQAYTCYRAARKIQANWRGKRLRSAYQYYCAARRIQTVWRCKRMHTAYRFYVAALTIQTAFRGQKARRDFLVLRGEFLAATLIQSAWRGFVCYTDYIFTVSDIIAAQKTARRYLARKQYAWQIQNNLLLRKEQFRASALIQKTSRGFICRQRYWYTLGCTMQIQSWIRGRLVYRRVQREKKARLKLQCFARRCLSRQQYLQRKFILALIHTADKQRTKKVAAMVIQQQCRTFLERKDRDRAARVIQRFFLMVKVEVDRIVKATKRKKNWRKKLKNRNDRVEDELLEDAWMSTMSQDKGHGDALVLALSASQDRHTGDRHRKTSTPREKKKESINQKHLKIPPKPKTSAPQGYFDRPSTIVRLHHDDDQSEFSGLTASTTNLVRQPASRMKKRFSRDMDEDLELEEAFIDAQIFTAKERRMAHNNRQGAITPSRNKTRVSTTTRVNVISSRS